MKPIVKKSLIALSLVVMSGVAWRLFQLSQSAQSDAVAYLVLGGSATREVYATGLKKTHPERLVLISSGSPVPCLYLMWAKNSAPMNDVWTERCSTNTFENFMYSLPLLERWNIRKVLVVSDYPQLTRAMPIARILFASHGMSVGVERVPQQLGDEKSGLEICGLIVMSLGWALVSQVYQPTCGHLTRLSEVNMSYWYRHGFDCEQQTGISSFPGLRHQ